MGSSTSPFFLRLLWDGVPEAGIQEVEYQLMVVPDSAHLLPFLGAGRKDPMNKNTTWKDLGVESPNVHEFNHLSTGTRHMPSTAA